MEKRTAMHLRAHLSMFEAGYPIQKGYIARLLIADSCAIPSVLKVVRSIVQTNEPDKHLHEGTLTTNLHVFKKLILRKKCQLTKVWPSLITLFLEPFPVTFKSLPVVPEFSPSRHPDTSLSPTSEMLPQPNIPVTSTLLQPVQNSTTINSPSCLMTYKLPSPRKLKSDCANCVNKQRTIINMSQKNKYLYQQLKQFKPLFEAENGKLSVNKLNITIKNKTQSVTKWKNKYASLSKACKDTYKLLKLVQSLEQQVKTLEGKLTAAQEENSNMASVNERLERLLEKTENDHVNLKNAHDKLKSILEKAEDNDVDMKQVHEQLKSILEKAEDNDVDMKQVHEQLKNMLEKTEGDDADLKRYSQAIHSPEMEIKEESPLESADNYGGNFALQNEEIKQEQIYEEHPERSWWKETSISDDSTAISKDVTSNISMRDKLCAERCQVKAEGDCLCPRPSIYIDNAEVLCEHTSDEDVMQTITTEEKVDQPNLFNENEAISSYTQLC